MPIVRIWAVESDNDRDVVKCLANKLADHLQLNNLSVQVFGKSALPKQCDSHRLKKATEHYLEGADCVIFVIDKDGPIAYHQRRQEPKSLINQVERVINDLHSTGKVFLAWAVQELEAWLLIDCLGIFYYFVCQSPQYRKIHRNDVMTKKPFKLLIDSHQRGNTENMIKTAGGKDAKECLRDFSEQILRKLNPNIPQKNVNRERYKEAISPNVAEYIDINQHTLQRNNSLVRLGKLLSQFNKV